MQSEYPSGEREAAANARLIAAAPDLLVALEAITNTSVSIDEGNAGVLRAWSECCDIARAAIAKTKAGAQDATHSMQAATSQYAGRPRKSPSHA